MGYRKMMSPYEYSVLKEPCGELLKQEIVSYVRRDDRLLKITVHRRFFKDDYIDSMTEEVLT